MLQQTIQLFNDKEEELVSLLVGIGMKRPVARMLVYLARKSEATSREIERGADLREPEVSNAVKHFTRLGWIRDRKIPSDRKGKPVRSIALALPAGHILDIIGKKKMEETRSQVALIRKLGNSM
jgi:predicted transcriptional regulator